MRNFSKRAWAMVLAIVLVFGLLPVVQFSADAVSVVNYVTDPDTGYIYNWGTRETVATYPSPKVDTFYALTDTDSDPETDPVDFTYEALSALSGAASLTDVKNSALYNALKTLMTSKHTNITSYQDTRAMYQYTDCQGSALLSNKISSFYSGAAIGPAWDGGATWNREHTWPNSKCMGDNDASDIMMLRPTATTANFDRSNTCYGESEGYYHPNSESDGTYDLRGDVARIALYIYVRWGNTEKLWGPDTDTSGVIESKDILLDWIEADPVDTWELGRNDSVESITGTRNVFVDYPELAFLLFNEAIPAMVTPSGEAVSANMNYTITAASNDEELGTVTVHGNIVTAFPGAGKYVDGYTVSPEGVTVTQDGNAFTVNATQDCTVTINFATATTAAASYMENGQLADSVSSPIGEAFVLPGYHGELPEGFSFWGWALADVDVTEDISATTIYKAGETYTMPAAGVSFYAVYAYLDKGTQGAWTLVTDDSQLYAGCQLVIASKDNSAVAATIPDGKVFLEKLAATFLDDQIAQLPAGALVLTLGGNANAWTLSDSEGQLLGATSDNNMSWNGGTTTWNITISEGALTMGTTDSVDSTMQYNASFSRFKVYKSGQKPVQLYILDTDAETLHYATVLPKICAHENTAEVPAQAATETEAGWTGGTYCYDCEKYIAGHEKLAPTGVSCTVSFVVPEGVAAVPSVLCNASGIALPSADAPAGYTFLGWSEVPVTETASKPALLEAGAEYTTNTEDPAVLYALYARTEAAGASTYQLVTSVNELAADKKVVIASADYDFALSTNQKSSNRGATAITKTGNKITLTADVQILTLKAGNKAGTFAFYTEDKGYLYAASSKYNYLKTQTTLDDNGSFAITIDANGATSVIAQGSNTRNIMRYNKGSSLFACYASNSTGVSDVCLYMETSDTTYYTTVIGDACAHTSTTLTGSAAPSCTVEGHTGILTCNDCSAVLSTGSAILPTGHASAEFVPAHTGTNVCTDVSWEAYYDCAACGGCYLTKNAGAEAYAVPTAPGHDYTDDATTCGTCDHVRMTLELTTVTLRPGCAGLYYKGEFTFDEEVSVQSYGITASLYDTEPKADGSDSSLYTEGTVGALITEILTGSAQDQQNAKTQVNARAYVQLTDGTYIYSDVVSASLQQVLQTIDSKLFAGLKPAQQEALAAMYEAHADVMESWKLPNLKEYISNK